MSSDLEHRLRDMPVLSSGRAAASVLARAARRARRRRILRAAAGAGAALVGAWLVFAPSDGMRPRGHASMPASVYIEAVAEGPAGHRPLHQGATCHADEQVVFRITTSTAGRLTVRDGDVLIWPSSGPWEVGAGRHYLGHADQPLAWTPDGDGGAGEHQIVAELCPPDAPCVQDRFTVGWRP